MGLLGHFRQGISDKLETPAGLPKPPKIAATATTQATGDQTHREQDAQAKQDERGKQWREHWEEERRKAGEQPPVYGPPSKVRSEPEEWRVEGEL